MSYTRSPTKLCIGVDGGTALPLVLVEAVLLPPVERSPGGVSSWFDKLL